MSSIDWPADEKLREWYVDDEMTLYEISERIGVSRPAVAYKLKRAGVAPRGVAHQRGPKEIAEIRKLYATGEYSQKEVGEMYGADRATVSLIIRGETYPDYPGPIQGEDYPPRQVSYIDWPDDDTLREWYEGEGLSQKEIADRLDCHYNSVGKKIKSLGLDTGWSPIDWPEPEALRRWHHDEEMTQKEIAERLDASRSEVYKHLKKVGVETVIHERTDWPDNDVVRSWYEDEGLTIAEAADRVGCAHRTARLKLQDVGADMRSPGAPTQTDWPPDHKLVAWKRNAPASEIADELGCSTNAVYYRLSRIDEYEGGGSVRGRYDDETIREIREAYYRGGVTYRELGEQYGCTKQMIAYIVTGEQYADAPGPIKGEPYAECIDCHRLVPPQETVGTEHGPVCEWC